MNGSFPCSGDLARLDFVGAHSWANVTVALWRDCLAAEHAQSCRPLPRKLANQNSRSREEKVKFIRGKLFRKSLWFVCQSVPKHPERFADVPFQFSVAVALWHLVLRRYQLLRTSSLFGLNRQRGFQHSLEGLPSQQNCVLMITFSYCNVDGICQTLKSAKPGWERAHIPCHCKGGVVQPPLNHCLEHRRRGWHRGILGRIRQRDRAKHHGSSSYACRDRNRFASWKFEPSGSLAPSCLEFGVLTHPDRLPPALCSS